MFGKTLAESRFLDGLGAELAAGGGQRNRSEALGTGLGGDGDDGLALDALSKYCVGTTRKKYTTEAIRRKLIKAVMNVPYLISPP
jgi:hypothetical protein